MHPPRLSPSCVTELISHLYIPNGCESVSIIKKRGWNFYPEYLTLNESEPHHWMEYGSDRKLDKKNIEICILKKKMYYEKKSVLVIFIFTTKFE